MVESMSRVGSVEVMAQTPRKHLSKARTVSGGGNEPPGKSGRAKLRKGSAKGQADGELLRMWCEAFACVWTRRRWKPTANCITPRSSPYMPGQNLTGTSGIAAEAAKKKTPTR